MGKLSRDAGGGALTGFLIGFGTRFMYDKTNRSRMISNYEKYGIVPTKKKMSTSLASTGILGSIGLLYSTPLLAVLLMMFEYFLIIISFGVLNILFRPIPMLVAYMATVSHNNAALELFGGFKD